MKDKIVNYPNIAQWVQSGTVEIGRDAWGYGNGKRIVARAIDEGGVVWEGDNFKNLEDALAVLEKGIKKWCEENY
jgi:hypothetical protein